MIFFFDKKFLQSYYNLNLKEKNKEIKTIIKLNYINYVHVHVYYKINFFLFDYFLYISTAFGYPFFFRIFILLLLLFFSL